jgi:hypothetical protein
LKQGLECPACKAGTFIKNGTFQTLTEAMGRAGSSMVTIDMMKCEGCGAELPAVRGVSRYAIIPQSKMTELLKDAGELETKRVELARRVRELEMMQASIREETRRSQVAGDVRLLEMKIGSLESVMPILKKSREGIGEIVKAIASTSHLAMQSPS